MANSYVLGEIKISCETNIKHQIIFMKKDLKLDLSGADFHFYCISCDRSFKRFLSDSDFERKDMYGVKNVKLGDDDD